MPVVKSMIEFCSVEGRISLMATLSEATISMSACGWAFFFQAEDGIRDGTVTGVQTCALPICHDPVGHLCDPWRHGEQPADRGDRKSTRLNSSHSSISYAVFCLKKKNSPSAQIRIEPWFHSRIDRPCDPLFGSTRTVARSVLLSAIFFLMMRPPPKSTLFPYTTLFR